MLKPIFSNVKETANIMLLQCPDQILDKQDIMILQKDGPEYLREVQTNIKLNKDPLDDLSDSAKKVLLAYVVFLRENIATEKNDRPNDEDSAKILHGKVFKEKNDKKLDEALLKQLSKIGINLKNDNKGD